jgi:hypothetical protein
VKTIKNIIIVIVVFLLTLIGGLGALTALKHDQIASVLVKELNNSINTKISYRSLSINLWSTFPNISVKFNDILVKPSSGYSKIEFKRESSDTLLFASNLYVSVDILALIGGETVIKGITIKDGMVNMLTDSHGNTNFLVINTNNEKENQTNIKLNNISAKNMKVFYVDHEADIYIKGKMNNSSLNGEIFGTGINLTTKLTASLDLLEVYGFRFSKSTADAELKLFKTKSSVTFREGSLRLGDLMFSIDGSTDYVNKWLDFSMKGQRIDISDISSILPGEYAKYLSGIKPGGIMDISCNIKGPYGTKGIPHIDINYNLVKGRLIYNQSGIDVNNLSLKGKITNGLKNSKQTFSFTIDTLNAALGAAYFNGSFRLENLENPFVELSLNGDLVFDDLRNFIKTKSFDSREGAVSGNLRMKGRLPAGKKLSIANLSLLNPMANLQLADFAADLPEMGLFFHNVSGKIRLADELRVENLCMTILGQKYCFNCSFSNFTNWVTGGGAILDITGDVSSDIFIPSAFAASQKKDSEKKKEEKPLSIFPGDVKAYVTFHADSVINKDFHAGNFNATLSYKPYIVSFNNLTADCLDGTVNGDMLIGLRSDGNYITKGSFNLNSINIRKAFDSFHNFGQSFIVGKNLAGSVSGDVSVLYQMDRNFDVIDPSIIGESHASVVNGRLIDFNPAEELSSFIEIEELKDISFSKLENDIFVRNSTVTLPKMEITSSVGWFSVYGNHNFSGDYTYHVSVLLSEILSKKAKTRNRNNTDFGQVADDEGNKTKIPLKLESLKGKFDVSYDFGQSKEIMKENFTEEKKNLKGILNEEYGWYKEDSSKVHKEQTGKPKFSITWEEGKEVQKEQVKTDEEDDSSLRQLFKKKK